MTGQKGEAKVRKFQIVSFYDGNYADGNFPGVGVNDPICYHWIGIHFLDIFFCIREGGDFSIPDELEPSGRVYQFQDEPSVIFR
jgi:hypothetical protein